MALITAATRVTAGSGSSSKNPPVHARCTREELPSAVPTVVGHPFSQLVSRPIGAAHLRLVRSLTLKLKRKARRLSEGLEGSTKISEELGIHALSDLSSPASEKVRHAACGCCH